MIIKGRSLEIVLKITGRCNIVCSFCYVFNKGDEIFKLNLPKISRETINSLVLFITAAIKNDGVGAVQVDFHGGEP